MDSLIKFLAVYNGTKSLGDELSGDRTVLGRTVRKGTVSGQNMTQAYKDFIIF